LEQLKDSLTIENATIEEWTHRRTKKEGVKVNFVVSAPLPKLLSEKLRCAAIYDADTGKIDLLHKIKEAELLLPIPGVDGEYSSFFPDVLYCFKARRDEQQFSLEFAVHVTTRAEELHAILCASPDSLQIEVRPRQGQLFEHLVEKAQAMTPAQQKLAEEVIAGAADPEKKAAPLAQAAVMGGTHQSKRKPRAEKGTVN
jgi:hypothetical protein